MFGFSSFVRLCDGVSKSICKQILANAMKRATAAGEQPDKASVMICIAHHES
jgi:hypothetical protein